MIQKATCGVTAQPVAVQRRGGGLAEADRVPADGDALESLGEQGERINAIHFRGLCRSGNYAEWGFCQRFS